MDLTSGECGYRTSHIGGSGNSEIDLYQVSMVLSLTSGGGKGTFPWDAHLQILAHDLLHGFFPSCHSHTLSAIATQSIRLLLQFLVIRPIKSIRSCPA